MRNRFAIKKRTFLRWAVSALFILVAFMVGCGGDNDEIDDWIIPENISGVWVAEFDRVDGLPGADQLEREYRFFVEESDGDVTGSFEALYYDGTHLNFPLVGSYNSGNGILKLTHDSRWDGVFTEVFRFTSEIEMYAVSSTNYDLPRYLCDKIEEEEALLLMNLEARGTEGQ